MLTFVFIVCAVQPGNKTKMQALMIKEAIERLHL